MNEKFCRGGNIMFTPDVIEQLNYYVYRLIDPRNGKTFYVGKGNRVFTHVENTPRFSFS